MSVEIATTEYPSKFFHIRSYFLLNLNHKLQYNDFLTKCFAINMIHVHVSIFAVNNHTISFCSNSNQEDLPLYDFRQSHIFQSYPNVHLSSTGTVPCDLWPVH